MSTLAQIVSADEAVAAVATASSGLGTIEAFQDLYGSYSRPIEGRAIWMDSGAIPKTKKGIEALVMSYKSDGFNILMPEVFRNGYTIYPSRLTTQLPAFVGFDPLPTLIREAHRRGMEVHPWVWAFRAGHKGDIGGILKIHPDWAAKGKNGEEISPGGGRWLCPSMPETRSFLLSIYREIVTNYDVDGLHLDYIRFENEEPVPYCYNDNCRNRFKAEYGVDPMDIDQLSSMQLNWNSWRERLVNSLVQEVATDLIHINPRLKLSAAVASEPMTARLSYMQNWPNWAANKWVDFLCPMTYTTSEGAFRGWVDSEVSKVNFQALLLPGIGLHLQKDPVDTLDQVDTARYLGASGVTLFASSYLQPTTSDALRGGQFSKPAKLPFRVSRKQVQRGFNAVETEQATLTLAERDAKNLLAYMDYKSATTAYVIPQPPPLSLPDNLVPVPFAHVPGTARAPVIDGSLTDPAWAHAAVVSLSYTNMGAAAPVATEVRLLHDDTALYIGVTAREPQMDALKAAQTKRDGPVFYDDSIELFLDPSGQRISYYQLAANTLGAQFDQKMMSPAWNADWKTASTKSSDSWTIEFAIPYSSLGATTPKPGDAWAVNIARNRFVTGKPEYLAWSVPYGSYNRLFRFGTLIFD